MMELLTTLDWSSVLPWAVFVAVCIAVLARGHGKKLEDPAKLMEMIQAAQRISSKLEDEVRHLPVIQQSCESCRFWDHEEGQAQLRAHTAFAAASQFVTPAMMSRKAELIGEDGAPRMPDDPDAEPEPVPFKASWVDVGACSKHNEGTFKTYRCDDYEARS